MRIAIAKYHLGNFEESENLFKNLISTRAGNDKWFLYRDIAEVYFENNDYKKAWKYSVNAAYFGNEPHFMIKLYLLQARILHQLNRSKDGKILADLIAAILKDKGWGHRKEYDNLFSFYKINLNEIGCTSEIFKRVKEFWNSERYGEMEKKNGSVIFIHRNGKRGKIKTVSGKVIGFHKKNLVKRFRTLSLLEKAQVSFYEMETDDGKFNAEVIEVIKLAKKEIIVGKVLDGIVKYTVEYGIFVKFPNLEDGLLHKNNLPKILKETFTSKFKSGEKIRVKIDKVTEKGLQLKLVDNT